MKKSRFYIFLSLLFLSFLQISVAGVVPNKNCLRCHSMKTLSYRDSLTNSIVNLYVDSNKFKASNHSKLLCTDCHEDEGFLKYPHSKKALSSILYCTDCHNTEEFAQFKFKERETEFKQSIHYKKLKDKFTCFNCHDPHYFKTTYHDKNVKNIVEKDNAICLNCHSNTMQLSSLTNEPPKNLQIAHEWLPNPQLHWKSVRCIECHTEPNSDIYSHKILPASQAVRKCEVCHSQNSLLFSKLYRFKIKETRQKSGFFKTLIYNTPFVIGMTKDPLIDKLSIIIFVLVLLGLTSHGLGRWFATRRKK